MPNEDCPVCQGPVESQSSDYGNRKSLQCRRCGNFSIAGVPLPQMRLQGMEQRDRAMLSAWIRAQGAAHVEITRENIDEILANAPSYKVWEKQLLLLRYLESLTNHPGSYVQVDTDTDYPVIWAHGPDEMMFHLGELARRQLITVSRPAGTATPEVVSITTDGWSFLHDHRQYLAEGGGRLAYLCVNGAGAMPSMAVEPAERLTLIAGDNGLGKTFLLDCAWWALSGSWASVPAAPREDSHQKAVSIEFEVRRNGPHVMLETVRYDWERLRWQDHPGGSIVAGLAVYACVDGSYAIWDPTSQTAASVYSKDEVWDGVVEGHRQIEGLVRDWRNWQSAEDSSTFETFRAVLRHLSPSDLGILSPGPMTRVPNDRREIPTIEHKYGRVPIIYASAAVKRVLSLAYLMVWTWSEHHIHCRMAKRNPERRMVILVDEVEAHLHPRWQRQLLPALVSVVQLLSEDVDVQLIVSTHSPLVLASSETVFSKEKDSLLHLQLTDDGIELREMDFMKFGRVDRWLMSDVFELAHARSKDAEEAIEHAKRIQREETPATPETVRAASDRLRSSLADDDEFWPRWIGFAERYGVEL